MYVQGLGYKVTRGADALVITVSPGDPYFTVAGGMVLLTGLIGYCTVAVGGANNVNFVLHPDAAGGADTPLSAAVDLTAQTLGDVAVIVGAPGTGLSNGHLQSAVMGLTMGKGLVVSPGVIGCVIDAALGTYRWVLFYLPIDTGAYVTAVAP